MKTFVCDALLPKGHEIEHIMADNNGLVRVQSLRGWLGRLSTLNDTDLLDPELCRHWGVALVHVLKHTRPQHLAEDSLFVGRYLTNVSRLGASTMTADAPPSFLVEKDAFGGRPRSKTLNAWKERPLFQQTQTILSMLGNLNMLAPVLANSVTNAFFSLDALAPLLSKCDQQLFPEINASNFEHTGRGALLSCVPTLLSHCDWQPANDKKEYYEKAWYFAASSDGDNNIAKMAACKNVFPENVAMQFTLLMRVKSLERDEVSTLFPLSEKNVLTHTALERLAILHIHQNKHPSFGYAMELFREHHCHLACALEVHLSLCPDGKPLEPLMTTFKHLIDGTKPESFDVKDLILSDNDMA